MAPSGEVCSLGEVACPPLESGQRPCPSPLNESITSQVRAVTSRGGSYLQIPKEDQNAPLGAIILYKPSLICIRQRALRVHFMTKVWSCTTLSLQNRITTRFLLLNALCTCLLLQSRTSRLSNMYDNVMSGILLVAYYICTCTIHVYYIFLWFQDVFIHIF